MRHFPFRELDVRTSSVFQEGTFNTGDAEGMRFGKR